MVSEKRTKIKAIASLVIWCLFTAFTALALRLDFLRDIESKTWDWRIRAISSNTLPDPRIKLIMIDQGSIDRFAQEEKIYWPWPRSLYTPIVDFLKHAGARGIAFDMLFTENNNQVGDDQAFADGISGSMPVIQALSLSAKEQGLLEEGAMSAFQTKQSEQHPFDQKYLSGAGARTFKGVSLPVPEILRVSAAVGSVNEEADEDRIFRRVAPGAFVQQTPILTLPFSFFHFLYPESDIVPSLAKFADKNGKYLLRFRGPANTYPWYTADAIITSGVRISEGKPPLVDPAEFKDAFVFLGALAPGLLDFRPGPFPGVYPGVEMHATTFDNLLHADFLSEVPYKFAVLAGAIALALVITTSMYFIRFQVLVLALLFFAWVALCFEVGDLGYWLPLVNPMVSMVLATIASVAFQYQLEGKQHRFIRSAFQYYVTPEVIDKIVADPTTLSLGGERRDLSIFFSDIAGFTSLSESMEPAKLVQFLNKFLSEMTDIILKSGGTIDKYEGDAIIAFWNAPLSIPDHHQRVVQVALACQRRLFELTDHFMTAYGVAVKMRVGLNTGVVTVGNFGSSTRLNYTIIGDAANLASRLEGANKVFGSQVLVSDATREHVNEGVTWRKLGDITVVGKRKIVGVWEPLDPVVNAEQIKTLSSYCEGLKRFDSGDIEGALVCFKRAEGDPVSQAYIRRIEKTLERPVDGSFSSVWNLSEK